MSLKLKKKHTFTQASRWLNFAAIISEYIKPLTFFSYTDQIDSRLISSVGALTLWGLAIVSSCISETETLNNFRPSSISQVCPDFPFLQNANLFGKCVRLDFPVSVTNLCSKSRHTLQIYVLEERKMWTQLRKSRRTEIVEGFQLRTANQCHQHLIDWSARKFRQERK